MYFWGKLFIWNYVWVSLKLNICVHVSTCVYMCVCVGNLWLERDLDFRSHPKLIFMQCCQPPDSTSATPPEQTQPEVFDWRFNLNLFVSWIFILINDERGNDLTSFPPSQIGAETDATQNQHAGEVITDSAKEVNECPFLMFEWQYDWGESILYLLLWLACMIPRFSHFSILPLSISVSLFLRGKSSCWVWCHYERVGFSWKNAGITLNIFGSLRLDDWSSISESFGWFLGQSRVSCGLFFVMRFQSAQVLSQFFLCIDSEFKIRYESGFRGKSLSKHQKKARNGLNTKKREDNFFVF